MTIIETVSKSTCTQPIIHKLGGIGDGELLTMSTLGRSRSTILVVGLLLIICLVTSFLYTTCWDMVLSCNRAIEYEGHVLWACWNLSQGNNIYDARTLIQPPWSVVIYTPVYFALGAALLKGIGIAFWPLRMLSMASSLLCLLGLFILLKRCKLSDLIAALGTCFFATYVHVIYWSSLVRVDMLGLAFAIWGMERFVVSMGKSQYEGKGLQCLIQSLLLFLAAFFTKQQYFVFPVSIALFYILEGQKRLGKRYIVIWLVASTLIASAIQCMTNGFFAHLLYATKLQWEWETLLSCMLPFLQCPTTVGAMIILATTCSSQNRSNGYEKLAVTVSIVSFLVALYTMGLRGAYHNHLLCTELSLSWLVALGCQKLSPRTLAAVLICILVGLSTLLSYLYDLSSRLVGYDIDARERPFDQIALSRLNIKGKLVLSDDASLPLLAGGIPAMVDVTTFLNVERAKHSNLCQFVNAIDKKLFPVVIIRSRDAEKHDEYVWPNKLVFTIQRNYRQVGSIIGNGTRHSVFLHR